ncbi:MAG: NCS2 family permease [Clostridiales bacterium]|nr:NCS2 family permease [Clostridiales bacterium]
MEKIFRLKERKTTVRIEIIGGLTTFFAMAYILFVNPNYLSATGMNWGSVFTATCIASAIGCFLTGFLANAPFAQAPGMGLNAFFAFTVATGAAGYGMGYTFQQGLTIVLLSGIIFLIVAISPLRQKIIASIPASLKAAISAGIGLFIAFIGFLGSGSGLIHLDEMNAITALHFVSNGVLNYGAIITIVGVILIGILMAWKVRGAIFIGIIATSIIYYAIGVPAGFVEWAPIAFNFDNITLSGTFFAFDFSGIFQHGALALITAVISFALVDCFDTVGTLVGTASEANLLDKDGNLEGGDKALIADAIATVAGACLGTSTVTTYVESSTGISEGARTGFSSIVVGILFVLALVFAPVAGLIPGAATAPALIIVGVLMMKNAAKVVWSDMEDAIPAFLTITMMPFAYSISDGIGFGFISYTIIKIFRGKAKQVPALMYVISILFILMYVLKNV